MIYEVQVCKNDKATHFIIENNLQKVEQSFFQP